MIREGRPGPSTCMKLPVKSGPVVGGDGNSSYSPSTSGKAPPLSITPTPIGQMGVGLVSFSYTVIPVVASLQLRLYMKPFGRLPTIPMAAHSSRELQSASSCSCGKHTEFTPDVSVPAWYPAQSGFPPGPAITHLWKHWWLMTASSG